MRLRKYSLMMCLVMLLSFGMMMPSVNAQEGELDPQAITQAIELDLVVSEAVDAHLIDVETNDDGIVELTGVVDNLLAKEHATRVAQSIKGVKAIVNQIEVQPVQRTDKEIQMDVEKALSGDPAADSYEVEIAVNDRVVTLTGSVESWTEKRLAGKVVKSVKGVKALKNNIEVDVPSGRLDSEMKKEIERRFELDPYVDGSLVDAKVEDGHVTLMGTVGSAAEKTYATTDAFVAGVESVDNEDLNVESWEKDETRRSQKIHVKSDTEIKRAVEDALRYDPRVTEFKIEVMVDNGRVTLNGIVDNLKAKRAARQDAENTVGVWRVKNFIKVRPLTTLTDKEIKNNVKEALRWNTVVDAENLTVKVKNKKAYLYGTVNTFYEKDQAEQTAAGVSGVVDVENYINANAEWEWKDDQAIKDDVEDELFWSLYVDSDDIEVSVEDGVASLNGTVSSWSELDAAIKNAFEGGAKSVASYLKIKQAPGYEPVTHYRHYYQWTY